MNFRAIPHNIYIYIIQSTSNVLSIPCARTPCKSSLKSEGYRLGCSLASVDGRLGVVPGERGRWNRSFPRERETSSESLKSRRIEHVVPLSFAYTISGYVCAPSFVRNSKRIASCHRVYQRPSQSHCRAERAGKQVKREPNSAGELPRGTSFWFKSTKRNNFFCSVVGSEPSRDSLISREQFHLFPCQVSPSVVELFIELYGTDAYFKEVSQLDPQRNIPREKSSFTRTVVYVTLPTHRTYVLFFRVCQETFRTVTLSMIEPVFLLLTTRLWSEGEFFFG